MDLNTGTLKLKRTGYKGMFKGAKPGHFELAKVLRNNPTLAEAKLWNILSGNSFRGLKFRRQHPLDGFILDFYCHSIKLAIEIDGDIHLDPTIQTNDKIRQKIIEDSGIQVVRFTNDQILENITNVLNELELIIKNKSNT